MSIMLRWAPRRAGTRGEGIASAAAPSSERQPQASSQILLPGLLMLAGLLAGAALAALGSSLAVDVTAGIAFATVVVVLIVLDQLELVATIIVAVSLFIDWYQLFGKPLRIALAATVLSLLLVVFLFLSQSASRPWVTVPHIFAWILFLVLSTYATLRWVDAQDSVTYYTGVIVNAFGMFVIGVQIARDERNVARLMNLLAGLGTIVAVHTILYVRLGIFLFATPTLQAYLESRAGFTLTGNNTADIRAGSFLYNPDWNGAFLALLVFLPIGLLLATNSRWARAAYAAETVLMLLAVLFTYSTAAIAAIAIGLLVFLALAVRGRRRIYLFGAAIVAAGAVFILFPKALQLLLSHATNPADLRDRLGLWETALNVIRAHPLTGVGMGTQTYFNRSIPYLSSLQPRPFAQPHETYLELAAMGGLPILVLFVFLAGTALWRIAHKLRTATGAERHVLASGIAALTVLSVNSLAINGWTVAPITAIAWLLLGALSSSAWCSSVALQLATPDGKQERPSADEPIAAGRV